MEEPQSNVLGGPLEACCFSPLTGYYRDGFCHTGSNDPGRHVVCVEVSEEFLAFSKAKGNDLSTPMPQYRFPGLKPGDKWCLCALRWREALKADMAPPVYLKATNKRALDVLELEDLLRHAADLNQA